MSNIHINSRASYIENEATGKGASHRDRVVALLKETGEAMTDRQIQTLLGVAEKSNIQPEVTRLKQAGYLRESGKVKCPVTGKTVRTVCINTPSNETNFNGDKKMGNQLNSIIEQLAKKKGIDAESVYIDLEGVMTKHANELLSGDADVKIGRDDGSISVTEDGNHYAIADLVEKMPSLEETMGKANAYLNQ